MRGAPILAGMLIPLLMGCNTSASKPGVIVSGKVLQSGKPLAVPSAESGGFIAIRLCPRTARQDGTPGDAAGGEYGTDGTATFRYAGGGVPPGKYLLTIELSDGTQDLLQGKFDLDQSQFEIVVPENKLGGQYDFGVIDLDSPIPAGS